MKAHLWCILLASMLKHLFTQSHTVVTFTFTQEAANCVYLAECALFHLKYI